MGKLIDKDKVVAEIERRIAAYRKNFDKADNKIARISTDGRIESLKNILSFLDTLEVKEINNVWHDTRRTIPEDGSEQIICIKEDGLAVSTVGKIVNGTMKWAYLGDLLNINSFNIEVKEVLEKEATEFVQTKEFVESKESPVLLIAKHFFGLGLKAQSKDMIEALRTEYEKGRADVIADTLSWLENCWPKYCSNQTIIEGFKEATKE